MPLGESDRSRILGDVPEPDRSRIVDQGPEQPASLGRVPDRLDLLSGNPDVHERLTSMGLTVAYQPQALFANRVKSYTQTWERIIKASGFQAK